MKRLAFLMGLLGLARAAMAQFTNRIRWKECVTAKDAGGGNYCLDKNKPALNNQCPVCGEMAGAYQFQAFFVERARLIRCKRCNAAFWQDGE